VVVNVGTQGESHSAEDCVRGLIDLQVCRKECDQKVETLRMRRHHADQVGCEQIVKMDSHFCTTSKPSMTNPNTKNTSKTIVTCDKKDTRIKRTKKPSQHAQCRCQTLHHEKMAN
jgi:hypothetical protein